ncbi:YobH family protein [Serratia sp. root2]|uniref:YobH family protein n=1 Tax=Serratia sp. root2 TaxID=3059676 RepID=UPI00289165DA|nr:YobH family protein [Serratia sp. root2]MDT3250003.1 YobH family protein [Serratia sp. root2]
MGKLIKWIVALAVMYGVFLFSGYGVLIGSNQNVGGLGLQCKYLTARNVVIAQYLHGDNGVIGVADCPLFKKVETVVD